MFNRARAPIYSSINVNKRRYTTERDLGIFRETLSFPSRLATHFVRFVRSDRAAIESTRSRVRSPPEARPSVIPRRRAEEAGARPPRAAARDTSSLSRRSRKKKESGIDVGVLTVELVPPIGQDLVHPLKSLSGGLLVLVARSRLQSQLHVRRAAYLAAAPRAAARFQLLRCKKKENTGILLVGNVRSRRRSRCVR